MSGSSLIYSTTKNLSLPLVNMINIIYRTFACKESTLIPRFFQFFRVVWATVPSCHRIFIYTLFLSFSLALISWFFINQVFTSICLCTIFISRIALTNSNQYKKKTPTFYFSSLLKYPMTRFALISFPNLPQAPPFSYTYCCLHITGLIIAKKRFRFPTKIVEDRNVSWQVFVDTGKQLRGSNI